MNSMNLHDVISPEVLKDVWEKVKDYAEKPIKPRIMVGGKTGVGKSSVLNAVLGREVYETGILPTSRQKAEATWESRGGDIVVVDIPGFGEAHSAHSQGVAVAKYEENQGQVLFSEAHVCMLILKADDRALEIEQRFLGNWQRDDFVRDLPLLVVVNQIDKMKPTRDWSPQELNLRTPRTEKEKNIRTYLDYVGSLEGLSQIPSDRILPFSAGETFDDPDQYGVEELEMAIYEALPDAAKVLFARSAHLKKLEARRIVARYAGLCSGAVLANFVPMSDALVLAPIQIAMIVHLGRLYGQDLSVSVASGILTNLGLSLVGRVAAQTLVSLLPGFKHVVGPPLAFSLTYTMGLAINEMLSQGKLSATGEEFKKLLSEFEKEGKEAVSLQKV